MSPWLWATCALLVTLLPCVLLCLRGGMVDRLVALELASTIGALALLTLAEGAGRPAYQDVALTLVVLTYPGVLVFTKVVERWL